MSFLFCEILSWKRSQCLRLLPIWLHIYRRACACVRACVGVGIKPSAAPGRAAAAPAKRQMVGVDMANSPPPPPIIPTCQPTSPRVCSPPPRTRSFCTLFAERKFSLHLRTAPSLFRPPPPPPQSSAPSPHKPPPRRSLGPGRRLITCDTALRGGNTTVGKTNKPERARQYSGAFEEGITLKSGAVMATSVVVIQSARCLRLGFHPFLFFFSLQKRLPKCVSSLARSRREEQMLARSSCNKLWPIIHILIGHPT